jgi:KDO2-lipid IV(A) lauroyltransferase
LRLLIHRLQYLGARALLGMIQMLPWGVARRMGRLGAWWSWTFDQPARKAMAAENLRLAFPEMDPRQVRRTVRGVYCHLADSIVDWLKLARLADRGRAADLFEIVGFEELQAASRGRGVVFVTGHFGHWEALGIAGGLVGFSSLAVGRSFENELLDDYIGRLRGTTGQRVVSKHGATLQLFRALAEGTNVALLIDQDARHHGIFVDFFGRPASTTDMAGRLCVRTGAPAVFVYAQRIPGRNRFRIVCADIVEARPGEDASSEVHRITQRLTRDLEEVVRQAPEQWLWLHRRWKTWPGKYNSHGARTAAGAPSPGDSSPERDR